MVTTFLLMLPFALAGAVSPLVLTEQTVVLASSGGRKTAIRYAAGAILTLFVYTLLLTVFGRWISFPTHLKLSTAIDVGLGVGLIALALFLRHRGRGKAALPEGTASKKPEVTSRQAFGLGVVGMATNVTTIAVVIPGAKIISEGGVGPLDELVLVVMLVAIAAIPAWLPIVLTVVAPGPAERFLDGLGRFLQRRGREIVVILLAALGFYMIIRGLLQAGSL